MVHDLMEELTSLCDELPEELCDVLSSLQCSYYRVSQTIIPNINNPTVVPEIFEHLALHSMFHLATVFVEARDTSEFFAQFLNTTVEEVRRIFAAMNLMISEQIARLSRDLRTYMYCYRHSLYHGYRTCRPKKNR